ncbi:MAG TPA: hypothetical protein PK624_03965 [Spirochaetota bacterium]|mgnify:CR=1 FL=1|nr:hypothetical protein [Spirochaetota bacterium]HOR43930.1 hypothetical protein [Spirochaetota bacterium]HOU85060.1 hypothetical protein [Spirochaetota bacterium]HPK55354.1 hypothetical protein [Spirochaetota bacterium]HQE59442.1 hypothetical protein [Spirochaetota bacterium]
MKSISLQNISYNGIIKHFTSGKTYQEINNFSTNLQFGKIYCLDTLLEDDCWGISWILTGKIKSDKGNIFLDDNHISDSELKKIGCTIGFTGYEKYLLGIRLPQKSVFYIINDSLKASKTISSIDELINIFCLTTERMSRNYSTYSGEKWRLSAAIGYMNNKKVFSSYWIKPEVIMMYKNLWLKSILEFLKENKCIVIIPTHYNENMKDLFDEIINLKDLLNQ